MRWSLVQECLATADFSSSAFSQLVLCPLRRNERFRPVSPIYRVYKKKTEQILNRPQRREAAQSMKFLINIDCLGTYDVE